MTVLLNSGLSGKWSSVVNYLPNTINFRIWGLCGPWFRLFVYQLAPGLELRFVDVNLLTELENSCWLLSLWLGVNWFESSALIMIHVCSFPKHFTKVPSFGAFELWLVVDTCVKRQQLSLWLWISLFQWFISLLDFITDRNILRIFHDPDNKY